MANEIENSILGSIKKKLGGMADVDYYFDSDLIDHINSVFSILNQLGVGKEGFAITSIDETWDEFTDDPKLNMVKTYVYLKVKQYFDPSQNSSVLQSYDQQIKELEWRLNVAVDPGE